MTPVTGQRLPDDLAARRQRAEAERLISDLAALIEAGLVVVEPHVLGPARYALGSDREDAA